MLFHVVLGACAVEDARTGFVSIFKLGLLLAIASTAALSTGLPDQSPVFRCSGAILLSAPFFGASVLGRAGWADPVGVLAVTLRYPFLRSTTIVLLACMLGVGLGPALVTTRPPAPVASSAPAGPHRRHDAGVRAIPFFPGLALAALIGELSRPWTGSWL